MQHSQIYLLLTVCHLAVPQQILPVQQVDSPAPINDHHLSCSMDVFGIKSVPSRSILMSSIHPDPIMRKIKGFLCIKRRYSLKCEENWLGVETLTRTNEVLTASESECKDAVSRWMDDRSTTDTQLLKNCGWAGTNVVTKDVFEIRAKALTFDPYTKTLNDPILLGGKCSSTYCETHYSGLAWLTLEPLLKSCPSLIASDVRVHLGDGDDLETIQFHSNYIPGVSLRGACKEFNYCGYPGIVLRTGHFFHMSARAKEALLRSLENLPMCPAERKVVSNNINEELSESRMDIARIFLLDKCRFLLEKIRKGRKITNYELSYLNPLKTGVGHGFVKGPNQTVLVGTYKYVLANSYSVSCYSCNNCSLVVAYDEGIMTVRSPTLNCQCSGFNGCYLPNGLKVYRDKLLNPLYDLDEEFYHQMNEIQLNPNYVAHPMEGPQKKLDLIGNRESSGNNAVNVSTFLPEFHGLFPNIKTYFLIGGLVCLVIIVVNWYIKCRQQPAQARPTPDMPSFQNLWKNSDH